MAHHIRFHGLRFGLGPVYVELGSMRSRLGRWWIVDGLHVWVGSRGVHVYWSTSPHIRRLSFERE